MRSFSFKNLTVKLGRDYIIVRNQVTDFSFKIIITKESLKSFNDYNIDYFKNMEKEAEKEKQYLLEKCWDNGIVIL